MSLFPTMRAAISILSDTWRWPHFSIPELACKCGGRFCEGAYWHDECFLSGLEAIRGTLDAAVIINSAHRCPQWNAAVGGAPLSRHKTIAADISLRGHDRFAVLRAAKQAGFNGLGLARTFLHVDNRPRAASWFYTGSKALWQT